MNAISSDMNKESGLNPTPSHQITHYIESVKYCNIAEFGGVWGVL